MYNLDRHTRRTDLQNLWGELKSAGYLQSIPKAGPYDSNFGVTAQEDPKENFKFTASGFGITCIVHGPVLGSEAGPPSREAGPPAIPVATGAQSPTPGQVR